MVMATAMVNKTLLCLWTENLRQGAEEVRTLFFIIEIILEGINLYGNWLDSR